MTEIKILREEKGLSQIELAELVGVHRRTIQNIEAGGGKEETIKLIAEALGYEYIKTVTLVKK